MTWTGHRFTNEMTSQVAKFQVLFGDYPDRIDLITTKFQTRHEYIAVETRAKLHRDSDTWDSSRE